MTSHFRVCILPGKLPLDATLFRYPMRIQGMRNFGFSAVLFPGKDLQDD
ncbi:MAG: hypothetical protein ABL858_04110 [Candidatus Nitrotoga sp.]